MTSSLRAAFVAAAAALALALGGAAASAGDLDDLLGGQNAAATLDTGASTTNLMLEAAEAAASEAAVETLLDAVAEAADE